MSDTPLRDPRSQDWIGVTFRNPATGETIEVVEIDDQGDSTELCGRLTVEPGGSGPPMHVHPRLDEWFEVESGELTVHLAGDTRVLEAGETAVIPHGTVHGFENRSDDPVTFLGGSRPGGRLIHVLATLFGLAQEGRVDDRGRPRFLQAMVFAKEFRDEMHLASPPLAVQRVLWTVFSPIGRLLGYRPTYDRYLRPDFWQEA